MIRGAVSCSFLGLLVGAVCPGTASAQVGLNFASGQTGTFNLSSSTSAGVAPQTNWNNLTGNIGTITTGTVVDAAGTSTTVTGSFTSTNTYDVYLSANQSDGNRQLLNGYLDNTSASMPTSVTVDNIPYATYDVYAYVGSNVNGRSGHVILGGSTFYYLTSDNYGGSSFPGFVLGTSTTLGEAADANYVLFANVSGPTCTLTNTQDSGNVGLHGIQIVQVPEPAGVLAIAAGFVAVQCWRRSRR